MRSSDVEPRRGGAKLGLGAVGVSTLWCAGLLLSTLGGAAALISTFQAGDASWHLGTIGIGQLDSSPDLEIVVPYRDSSGQWFVDAFKWNGQRLPGFPYSSGGEEMNVSPTLYDLDHDGRDEILFTRGNHVIALRGDGSVMWSNTVNYANYVPSGGYQTVTNGFYWWPTGAFMSRLPATAVFSSQVSPPMVMDVNGNGTNEIVTAWKIDPDPSGSGQDFNPFISDIYGSAEWGTAGETWSGGVVVFDANTGNQNFVYHIHQLVESGLAIGRAKPGPALNIYELNDSDSVVSFDKTQPFGLWGKGMLHKQFGKNQALMTGSYQLPIDIYTADINGDGLDEVLVAGTQFGTLWQPNETILGNDGAVLWRHWLPHVDYVNDYGWNNSACLIPVNPDHDNHIDVLGFNHGYEITFRYWNGVELVDRPGWPKSFYPFLPTPPVVGDVDGDGQEEIIIGTYDPTLTPSAGNLLIYALDGTLKQSIPVAGGIKHIPALGDVEGIGRLDVVYRSTLGQVYVQNFGATGTNHVSWATHRGNMHRDGNRGVSLFPPGTPLVTKKSSGYNRVSFNWTNASPAECFRIYRAEEASGPFQQIATVTSATTAYTDYGLKAGWQYFYEVGAVYSTNTVHSSPFAVLPLLNSNLIANAGFEQNDNSHWDKWYSGSIGMTNMVASTNTAYQGRQSMRIILENQGDNGSISQFNQYGIPDSTLFVTPGAFYSFGGFFKSTGISQPSEHFLKWVSTKTGYDTNNRPDAPYPNYFTPHFVAGTGATEWTYENRTFQLPAGIPNLELAHNYTISAPGSGSIYLDNIFFRQIPSPSATNWTVWVPFGSTWRFFAAAPPANWFAANFNDAAWPVGAAKFGAGGGPTNVVTALPQMLPAYYFRKTFNVASTDFEELLLCATCTDVYGGTICPLGVFINGTEVKSTIEAVSGQGNEVLYFDLTPFAQLIQPGANTIAVKLGNTWASDWDDVAFDVSLRAVLYHPVVPRLTAQNAPSSAPRLSVETPPGSIWQIQSCDDLALAAWQVVRTFTNTTGGVQTFQDTGQNGRVPAVNVRSRFYRLAPF
ncbi:MAG TPA: hypothetical protein VNZ64_04735 [Candidatus Acidoferrum sp.]|jgi:hypothetical protein|nr:hypothetical protein [Candidatus Acidoferrum sp.]